MFINLFVVVYGVDSSIQADIGRHAEKQRAKDGVCSRTVFDDNDVSSHFVFVLSILSSCT